VLAAAAALAGFQMARDTSPVDSASPARLGMPVASCSVNGTASVSFNWFAVPGEEQWLDLGGVDGNFAVGSFQGRMLEPGVTRYTWSGVPGSVPQLWRVNTWTGEGGWVTSSTGAFVACGAPALLWATTACNGPFQARVDFKWAPTLIDTVWQFLDIGFDPGFAPGTFTTAGEMPPSQLDLTWEGLNANVLTFYRINALGKDGVWRTSPTGSFLAECVPPVNTELRFTNDRLLIPRFGVDAQVNVRDVALDGVLGNPEGPEDVVRYNFPLYPTAQAYPGNGGTTMIAGHVDFAEYGLAVFAPLRSMIAVGDIVEYVRFDGVKVSYVVDWVSDLPPEYPFGQLATNNGVEALVLVTCNGEWNWDQRAYSHRRVVHATIVP
jgi:hypothetical protein